ncbi:MAG: TonB-dependent receptor [Gammaproteobacteria bacterium]|nr:TonB-dependent receptor [Gammaproteobacteria bacterium]
MFKHCPITTSDFHFRKFTLFHKSIALALVLSVSTVQAQQEQTAEGDDQDELAMAIEEIVVTAEKREENVLEVPLTLTALSAQMLEELGLSNALDLEQLVPGLQFGSAALQQRSDGQGITIRGIGTQSARELHSDLAVAVYVDGVYTVDTYGLAPNLFDVERVEVARGPQGTLNGRNSIAGSISYHTRKPTAERDTIVLAEMTDQATQRINAAFGGAITDSLFYRLRGGFLTGDGSQENVGVGNDLGAPDQRSFAPQLRFKNDVLDVNLGYEYTRDQGSEEALVRFADVARNNPRQGNWFLYDQPMPSLTECDNPPITGVPGTSVFQTTPIDAQVHCDDLQNIVASNRNGVQDSETTRVKLNIDWEFSDSLILRYTFGNGETHTAAGQDGDGTARVGRTGEPSVPADLDTSTQVNCPDVGTTDEYSCWTTLAESGLSFEDTETIHRFMNDETSHELQLISNFDGPFNYVTGIYSYENETFWDQGGFNYAAPWRFVDADEAAVAASPIFGAYEVTSCQSYLDDFFIPTFGDPSTGIVFGSFGVGCPMGTDHVRSSSFFSSTVSETRAAFVNLEYQLDDQWNISGGLRWTKDEKVRTGVVPPDVVDVIGDSLPGTLPNSLFVGDFFGTGVPVVFTGSAGSPTPTSWEAVIGHVSLEYVLRENLMYYGRLSTGYRAGGFNWQYLDVKSSFDEEELVNYEFGVKGLFLDDRVQFTGGVFLQDFENYQLTALQPVDPIFLQPTDDTPLREHTINVGDSTVIWGFEGEFLYHLSDRWRLSGFYSLLQSELGTHSTVVRADPDQEFEDYVFTNPGADPAGPDGVIGTPDDFQDTNRVPIPRDHTGDELPQMPNHKFAATAAYLVPLAERGSLQLLGTWSFTGERWPQRAGNIPKNKIPSYSRLDLRANWDSADGVWSTSVYVQNVFDKIGISESISIDLQGSLTEPRQIGAQLRWRPQP